MTLLVGFQGEGCALIASDLMLKFVEQDQFHLPMEERTLITLICSKFRQNSSGDYLAFHGRLRQEAMARLYGKTLEELKSWHLNQDSMFSGLGIGESFATFYVSVRDAQLYVGEPREILQKAQVGKPYAAGHQTFGNGLMDVTLGNLKVARKFDKKFLRDLSDSYESYMLRNETSAEPDIFDFGGYESFLVSPGEIRLYKRTPGKLSGCKEAVVGNDGLIYF